jgi:uncharacterized protein (DUF433 family)
MDEPISWADCAFVEQVSGKMGGQPVIKGTRLKPADLLANREQGVDWLVENHGGISPDTVRELFAYYDRNKRALAPTFG